MKDQSSSAFTLLDSIDEPAVLYTSDFQVLYANRAASRLPLLIAGLSGILRDRALPADCEYTEGGRSFEVHAYPAEGGIAALLHERTPARLDEMLEALMENIPIGIAIADAPDVRIRWVSRQGREMTGYTDGRISGVPFMGHAACVFEGDGLTRANPEELPLTRATRHGETIRGEEWVLRNPDGTPLWILCDAAPIRDRDGTILGGLLAFTDITERKRSDEALRRSEARLRLAQSAAHCGSWDWNVETDEVEWSDAYYDVFGIPRSTPSSFAAWVATLHPDDRERTVAEVRQAIADRTDFRLEFRAPRADGEVRWFESIGRTICDAEGDPVRVAGIALDITDRKRAEEELEDTASRLRRSNEELQKFAYVVSHDLQEPLRMVRTYAELLGRRQMVDAEGAQFLAFIGAGVSRMQTLIRDLLEYSRISFGEQRAMGRVESGYAARLALEHLRPAIERSKAEVTFGRLPSVTANDALMIQVFQNLIGNAIKYHSADTPKIHVEAERRGSDWVFSVRDNGIGIDPAYHERIFGAFQRLHPRDEYEGSGIGLAIVKRIIEQHGGRVWVNSAPGAGATFYFALPAEAAEAAG